ncbi:MAG: hypothetical protein ABI383_16445 [Acidobacteriaceae bacterium]
MAMVGGAAHDVVEEGVGGGFLSFGGHRVFPQSGEEALFAEFFLCTTAIAITARLRQAVGVEQEAVAGFEGDLTVVELPVGPETEDGVGAFEL